MNSSTLTDRKISRLYYIIIILWVYVLIVCLCRHDIICNKYQQSKSLNLYNNYDHTTRIQILPATWILEYERDDNS